MSWESILNAREREREQKIAELDPWEFNILFGVPPKRGTQAWDTRERIRLQMGCGCLSFGKLP